MAAKITRGSVFQRVYRTRDGELKRTHVWYVKYYANGKPVTLPAETEDYDDALSFLRRKMANAVTSSAIARYVAERRREAPRPANGTINRALAYVRRAMKLGAQQDPPLVMRVPHFDMLPN